MHLLVGVVDEEMILSLFFVNNKFEASFDCNATLSIGCNCLVRSSTWCSNRIALLTHPRVAVPMDIGCFFFWSLVSLYNAVKYCEPKSSVVVGDSWLFVVMSSIFIYTY